MELAIQKDCEAIIDSFIANENPRFESFVYQWKSTLFQSIYSGQSHTVEIIQSTNACIHYAKRILSSKNTMHKLGALFLLYAIHFKQPTDRFHKIDVDLTAWKKLKDFVFSLDNTMYAEGAKCIFLDLLKADSFRFVASDTYFGLENLLNLDRIRSNVVNLSTSIHTFRSDMKYLSSPRGLFVGIQKLDDGYNEMKELMNQTTSTNGTRYVLPMSRGFKELKTAFASLQALVNQSYTTLRGKKTKKKPGQTTKKGAGIGKTRQMIKRKRCMLFK